MAKRKNARQKKLKAPGLPPGSVIYTGQKTHNQSQVTYCRFNENDLFISDDKNDSKKDNRQDLFTWIDVRGLHDITLINEVGKQFDIHPLMLEDIVNVHQRPKYETIADRQYITLKALAINNEGGLEEQHMSFYFDDRVLISFQEDKDDYFSVIRKRLENPSGRMRRQGVEYLVYCMIDLICDNYYLAINRLDESIDALEYEMLAQFKKEAKIELHHFRVLSLEIKKKIFPVRDIVLKFIKLTEDKSGIEISAYYRDLYDHIIHINESIEMTRDNIDSLSDVYNTQIGLMNNEIIQTLTIISTIFIPVTFIAGVYGMNFVNMPELEWGNGYWYSLMLMAIVVVIMLVYFKRKRWI